MKTPIRADQIWMARSHRAHSHTRIRLLRVLAVTTDQVLLTLYSDRSLDNPQKIGLGARRTIKVGRMRFHESYRLYGEAPEE